MHNYEELSVDQLNEINDDLSRKRQEIKAEQEKLLAVRNRKLKIEQVVSRYKGKVKPEDVEILRQLGALPADEGAVLKPGVAVAAGATVKPAVG